MDLGQGQTTLKGAVDDEKMEGGDGELSERQRCDLCVAANSTKTFGYPDLGASDTLKLGQQRTFSSAR